MTTKFYAILTNQGAARLANAAATGKTLNLTHMAVGDANGSVPNLNATQTALINQKRIAPLNMLSIDPKNTSQIIVEQIIPENEGGYWIREIGLFDDEGVLIAIANCPETYKPQLQEGSGRTQTIRMVLIVANTAAVTLKTDPSVVLATRQYVDQSMVEHVENSDPHPQYLAVSRNLAEIADGGSAAVEKARENLGLETGASMPAVTGLTSESGYLSVPALMSGEKGNMLLQWKRVSITQSLDGNMVVVEGQWPIAFPNACLSINPSLTNSLIYATNGTPFTSAAIVDRANFKVACAYTKSPSTVTVWGIGF